MRFGPMWVEVRQLITRFTVPRTAQYKVVDEIAHR